MQFRETCNRSGHSYWNAEVLQATAPRIFRVVLADLQTIIREHYQITLQRPSDMNDKSTWCKTAAFSDEKGVIFLGQAIDCEAAPR